MKITITNTPTSTTSSRKSVEDLNQLKVLFEKTVMEDKDLLDIQGEWVSDSEIVLNQMPSLSLHRFLLKAEKLGKNIEYKKQTVINIID